jgi:5S rRNA maturation endonuclease (ribonuclease M5)
MTREEIIARHPLREECERRGMEFKRAGREWAARCCFHEDRSPSFRINEEKQTWFCDPCNVGGSVIDFIARADGQTVPEVLKRLGAEFEPLPVRPQQGSRIVKEYNYQDATGALVFQVVRLEPKSFRQRRKDGDKWSWSMEGVERVLYRLPVVAKSEFVWIVEGEKDADALESLGFCATCNPGGAGKWLESYSESLRGKEIILCGDNDEPGRKHIAKVAEAIGGFVKTTRTLTIPAPHKDVSDLIKAKGGDAKAALVALAEAAEVLVSGVKVPVLTMAEMEARYRAFIQQIHAVSLNLGAWLPRLGMEIRPLVPGELVTIMAGTGVGKTMLLQNLAINTRLPTLMFELELPDTLTFERYAAMASNRSGASVESMYRVNGRIAWESTGKLDHIAVCPESRLTPADIQRIIEQCGLKTGRRPALVLMDYIQLVQGKGNSRYERASNVAEELKVIAKATNTIIVIASQVGRKPGDEDNEVGLFDAKESGSIENSSGLVLGAWRDAEEKSRMWIKVCKNTKGTSGVKVSCKIREGLVITEDVEA